VVIKQGASHALQGVGIRLHIVPSARLVYPRNGPIAGYFYRHPDPPISVYWLDDIMPSIERAIENYQVLAEGSVFA
jgi:hypothetical protein